MMSPYVTIRHATHSPNFQIDNPKAHEKMENPPTGLPAHGARPAVVLLGTQWAPHCSALRADPGAPRRRQRETHVPGTSQSVRVKLFLISSVGMFVGVPVSRRIGSLVPRWSVCAGDGPGSLYPHLSRQQGVFQTESPAHRQHSPQVERSAHRSGEPLEQCWSVISQTSGKNTDKLNVLTALPFGTLRTKGVWYFFWGGDIIIQHLMWSSTLSVSECSESIASSGGFRSVSSLTWINDSRRPRTNLLIWCHLKPRPPGSVTHPRRARHTGSGFRR